MKRWKWLGGVALVLVMVVAGVAANEARKVESNEGVQTSNAFANIRDLQSPLLGMEAPKLGLQSVTTGSLDLGQQKGKLVLVTFWSEF